MAQYPIKMLKDENGTPFVPLVAPEAVKDNQGTDWQTLLNSKLEKTNIIAGDNITLSVSGNNITINSQAGGAATNVIDNLNQQTAGVGVLDAHQGYVLKGMIPGVQNTLTSTSTTDALSAYQGYLLSNRSVPGGGTINQVLAKNSATDNDLKWVSLADVATSGNYADLSNKPTIPGVVNNLTSTSTVDALSASQGKILNDKIYPVGSIYMSVNSTDPATLFGGTWEQIKDVFLLSAGDTYTAGSTGGSKTNTLVRKNLPDRTGYWAVNPSNRTVSGVQWGATSGNFVLSDLYDINQEGLVSDGYGVPVNNMPPYIVVYVWKRIA